MARNRERVSRYEFSTRILSRAERLIKKLLAKRGMSPGQAGYRESFHACYNLAQELIFIRLLENSWVLESGWLQGFIERNDLSGLFKSLEEFNATAGLKLFIPELSASLGLETGELARFVHELYSETYLPRKSPPELLGGLLEKLQILHPEQAPFFTPQRLVQIMVDESLGCLGLDHGQINGREFRILDPGFGSGNFLAGLLRKMIAVEEEHYSKRPLFYPLMRLPDLTRYIEFDLRIELCKKHLFGLDLSEQGKQSALRCLAVILLRGKPWAEVPPGELAFLDSNLATGDFLVEEPLRQQIDLFDRTRSAPLAPFSFSDPKFPHHEAAASGGFDLIIGNPPWLSLKGKHGMSPYSPEAVAWLVSRYQADSYRPNLFEMFIRRAVQLLKQGGINCFIVPDRMAENLQFQPLRIFLTEIGEVIHLHFREHFPGVVSDTLIYWFKKMAPSAKKIRVTDAKGSEAELSVKKFSGPGGGIEKEFSPEVSSLLAKIRHQSRAQMSDYLTCGVGLIARPGSIHAQKQDRLEQPLIKGKNLRRWKVTGNFYFEFHPRNLLGGTIRYSKLTARERILVRKTGARLIAARDRSGNLVEQSLYFLIPRPDKKAKYALEYFLALINSPLLNFYYRNSLITNPESAPQLKKFHLDQLPVKRINLKDQYEKEHYEKLIELVRRVELAESPDQVKELELEINTVVFHLYNLKPAEMKLLEEY